MKRSVACAAAAALLLTACADDPPAAAPLPSPSATTSPTPAPEVTTAPAPPTTTPPPVAPRPTRTAAVGFSVARVTAADLGSSWRSGCPVGPARLRAVTVPFVGFDGTTRTGVLVVHERVADEVGRTFVRLRDARFPIRMIRPVHEFGSDDDRSMAADNTSAFNCRAVVGGSGGWSQHAYGTALDLNPRENPYVYADGTVAPPEGRAYTDRSRYRQGMVMDGGVVTRAFAAIGWGWGGRFRSSKDYQHFSESGR